MRALYSPEEIQLVRRFGNVANRVTTKELGGVNASSTGAANQILNGVDNVFGPAGRLMTGLLRRGGAKARDITAETELKQSLRGVIPRKPTNIGTGGLIGATTASQQNNK